MPSTLIPACPLCGLRFSNRALLDLHLREDHLERNRPAEPDRDDSDDAGASRLRAGGPSGSSGLASGQPRTTDEVVPVTAATLRPRSRWAMTVAHRAVRVPRYVSEELARGSKAIIRSARRKTRLNVLLSEQRVSVWRRRPGRLVSRSVRPGDPRCRPARPGDRGSGIRRRPASRAGAQRARFESGHTLNTATALGVPDGEAWPCQPGEPQGTARLWPDQRRSAGSRSGQSRAAPARSRAGTGCTVW